MCWAGVSRLLELQLRGATTRAKLDHPPLQFPPCLPGSTRSSLPSPSSCRAPQAAQSRETRTTSPPTNDDAIHRPPITSPFPIGMAGGRECTAQARGGCGARRRGCTAAPRDGSRAEEDTVGAVTPCCKTIAFNISQFLIHSPLEDWHYGVARWRRKHSQSSSQIQAIKVDKSAPPSFAARPSTAAKTNQTVRETNLKTITRQRDSLALSRALPVPPLSASRTGACPPQGSPQACGARTRAPRRARRARPGRAPHRPCPGPGLSRST